MQGLVRDEPDSARGDRADAVVKNLQVQALEVGDITRDVEVEDLARARAGDLVGAGEAVLDKKAARGAIADAHDVLIGFKLGDLDRQALNGCLLVLGKRKDPFQLLDQRTGMGGDQGGVPFTLGRPR